MRPLVVYTGTQVWVGRPEIRPSRKGRHDHGPGIYFTTRLQTARKYAKGRGTVLRVEIEPSFTWLEDAIVPLAVLTEWVEREPRLRRREEILQDLYERAGRGLAPGEARASALVNLLVHYDAMIGSHGPSLAAHLAQMGIGASHVRQSNEDWIVLFDPTKVLSWRRIEPGDAEDLPSIRR